MAHRADIVTPAGTVRAVFTDRADGDFAIASDPEALLDNRRSVVDRPWTWFHQVHGDQVVEVVRPGQWAGVEADGAVTTAAFAPLAIMTADCAPVVLVGERGFAVVHAGWRGLVAGIVERAAHKLRRLGAGLPVASLVGPCINPEAYEFSATELAVAAGRLGPTVRSETSWGTPALDVPAAVTAACRRAGWPAPSEQPRCTSEPGWFSHRSRAELERQATVVWLEPTGVATDEGPA
jgi:copper oxidase (laccase) domain-containing protein